jgi:histidine ammonia-lyase
MLDNTATIIGIELLAAAQGIEFLRPLKSSPVLEEVHALLRIDCPSMPTDHYLAPDIERATALVMGDRLRAVVVQATHLRVFNAA